MTQTNLNRRSWATPTKSSPTAGEGDRSNPAQDDGNDEQPKRCRPHEWIDAAPADASWRDVAESSQNYDHPDDVPGWNDGEVDTEGRGA